MNNQDRSDFAALTEAINAQTKAMKDPVVEKLGYRRG